jgi:putative DNA primase/helicase
MSIAKLPKNARKSDWHDGLAPSGNGFVGDERNVLIALRSAPELFHLTRYNSFALTVEFTRSPPWRAAYPGAKWTETDDTCLAAWLQEAGLKLRGTAAVANCIGVAAQDIAFHPVRDFLNALKWDGTPRLKTWARTYLGAEGVEPYLAAVGTRFTVSAVARIMRPGCQADHVLVLESPQGAGKTSAVRSLAYEPTWYAGSLPDVHTKDAALQLAGRWIVEISELRAVRNSQLEAVKAFITETIATFRPPYGRRTAQFPRQCVFVATTNEADYMRDRTGNRRYWPIKCTRIDVDAIQRDLKQIWAEALHLFNADERWHLTDDEARLAIVEQRHRMHVTETEQDVGAYLSAILERGQRTVTVHEVLTHGLRLDPDSSHYALAARQIGTAVAEAMTFAGWRKLGRQGSERRTVYQFTGEPDKGDKG